MRFWAPACAGPRSANADRGFTLVELMIVMTIFALAAAAVVLTLPDARARIRRDAERFAARTKAAHDAAIVGARPVSVWIAAGGYGFDERVGGRWRAVERPLGVAQWSSGVTALAPDQAGRTRIVFDPTGLADRALSIDLRREGQSVRVSIGTDGAVRIDG